MKRLFPVKLFFAGLFVMQLITGCNQKKPAYAEVMHDPRLYSNIIHQLSFVIIYDIFSPPVASRIYAYSNLAAFEVLGNEGKHFSSLEGKVKGLNNIPHPPAHTKIDYPFASLIALFEVGNNLLFLPIPCSILLIP